MGLPCGALAQQEDDLCDQLKTPKLIYDEYLVKAHFKPAFPCLAKMVKAGNYQKSPTVWNDYMFPVIDHYFSNDLHKDTEYKLTPILWQIMVGTSDEKGATAVSEFPWSEPIKSEVSKELERFYKPASINVSPAKATIGKNKEAVFTVTYLNQESIPLASLSPNFSSEVNPAELGTVRKEGDKVIVTSLKGGNKSGTLVVSDEELGLTALTELTFTGRMSVLWPIGGLAVTGGAAALAATTDDDGTSTALWTVTGVSAVVTGVLIYKYLRGEGVPFLSKPDTDRPENSLAVRFVPGPRSVAIRVQF
jgi:hypothetical protein